MAEAAAGASRAGAPLPGGALLGSRRCESLCGAIGVALLRRDGRWPATSGRGTALDNWAPTFILITFWVGLVFAVDPVRRRVPRVQPVAGDRPARRAARRARWRRPYPERLGRWPAAVGLLIFTWIELVGGWGEHAARRSSTRRARLHGRSRWPRRRLGRRDVDAPRRGVRRLLQPVLADRRVRDARRRASACGRRSAGCRSSTPAPGTVALVAVMIGTVTFDGLSQGRLWSDLRPTWSTRSTRSASAATTAAKLAGTVGLLARRGARRRLLLARDRGRAVGRRRDDRASGWRRGFIHTLVPIAAVYVAAHYLTFLVFEGQAIIYLASDPFGQGWDLFGTRRLGDRLLAAQPERRLVPRGRLRRDRPRRRADARPRPRAGRSTATPSWPCARSTGCSA